MSRFVQLHLLTSYPPANLNRDDLGRPKTAMMGGVLRLRISSQSLKRAWRTSSVFEDALKGQVGKRTKLMGTEIYDLLKDKGKSDEECLSWSNEIIKQFVGEKGVKGEGKGTKKEKKENRKLLETEQLVHYSPEEENAIKELVEKLGYKDNKEGPQADDLKLLRKEHTATDIALFGRMLASSPEFNTEASVQVAHAISVHSTIIEDDFFTAVDDLNTGKEDLGAGHLGETEFAAGLFYLYLCVNKELLVKNLSNNTELANRTLSALIESASTVAPTGKQNSFGSRARASYILCESGDQQPRSLSVAFLKPVSGNNMLETSIKNLTTTYKNMDDVYGKCADARCVLNAHTGKGSINNVIQTAVAA